MARTLEDMLETAEFWANKNGYEQEALREVLAIIKILINEGQKSKSEDTENDTSN